MPEFPIESFGPHIEDILAYATDTLNFFDDKNLLWVIAAFSIVILVLSWAINTVRKPPKLDI
jgi:hypothetical protein